ncbi:hypothetical protein ACFL0Q_02245 [Thermodesulfobacteriota bacterium]
MDLNKVGWLVIVAVLMAISTIVVVLKILESRQIEVRPETNCPKKESMRYPSTVVIIDRTDPITPSQKRYLLGFVEELKRSFSLFEKVAIYPIDSASRGAPLPLFERCNPGSPDDANVWFENPEQIREKFEIGFSEPFEHALEASIADATSETSPILDTIQAVMSNHSLDHRITRQRLVLVSDMLQNMPAYSHYQDGYSYRTFVSTVDASRSITNLLGVRITLVYLWRPSLSPEDVDNHLLFWEEYFRTNGGVLEQVFKVR